MAIATGTALAAAGLGASVLGAMKGNKGAAPQQQGFSDLPKAVQEAWLNVALPKIMDTANRPYQSMPMQRVNAPSSIYDSQGLYDLQKYSDSVGGFFNPINRPQGAQSPNQMQAQGQMQGQPQPQLTQDDFAAFIRSINPDFGMTNNGGQMIGGTNAQNQERQRMALESVFRKYGGR